MTTAKLLRLANSAYYGFSRRIGTVRDAVVLVGFRAVRAVVLVSCVMDTVTRTSSLDASQAWHFSVAVGLLAGLLARTEGLEQDAAFTAGVLHNIGLTALDQHRPDALREVLRKVREEAHSLADAERLVLGFTDAELGGALAEHWGFPPTLVDAIRDCARSLDALPDRGTLTACVLRARLLARAGGLSDGIERGEEQPADAAMTWLLPPFAAALNHSGGMPGVIEKADAFLAATVV